MKKEVDLARSSRAKSTSFFVSPSREREISGEMDNKRQFLKIPIPAASCGVFWNFVP
jgi:hypothetical protein